MAFSFPFAEMGIYKKFWRCFLRDLFGTSPIVVRKMGRFSEENPNKPRRFPKLRQTLPDKSGQNRSLVDKTGQKFPKYCLVKSAVLTC
ncbi:MAG: hypothetical protein WCY25_04945 [Moheibacter sp.]